MTDKIVDWNAELTGYYDADGLWIELDKEEDLVKLAMSRSCEEKDMSEIEVGLSTNMKTLGELTEMEKDKINAVIDEKLNFILELVSNLVISQRDVPEELIATLDKIISFVEEV